MYDTSSNFLNVHEWAYGATEVVHILSLAVGIGLIALVDLRLLGGGLSRTSAARLARATTLGSLVGLIVAVTTGLMILSTDPIRYIAHPTMRFKLFLVPVAIAFNYTIRARVIRGAYLPVVGRSVAVVSLTLWVSIVFSGLFYSFT